MIGALFRLQNTGYFKEATSNGRYLWAIMAFQNIDSSGRHAKTFMIYYKNDYEIDESAQRLNVSVSEEQERHSAYLDQVTAGATDEADQLNRTRSRPYAARRSGRTDASMGSIEGPG